MHINNYNKSLIILLSCPDQEGIVAKVSNFVWQNIGNILHFEQYVEPENNTLFMRVEASISKNNSLENIKILLSPVIQEINAHIELAIKGEEKTKVALFVSRHLHCLQDLLWRYKTQELDCEIPVIISNHEDARGLAEYFGIDYHCIPMDKSNKQQTEAQQIELLEKYNIDLVVLARYMQILSEEFIAKYLYRIINIHHSFLPAFIGGNPYKQALERGVKIIGATSHYATADLDEGPIIEQDITRISHNDNLDDLKNKGKELERLVLARAIKLHLDKRVLVSGHKTIVFDK